MSSVLYQNATILAGEDFTPVYHGYLGTEGAFIDYIGSEKPEKKYDTVKDMDGAILLPGLYNAHTHAAMTLLRGVGAGLPLERWLNEAIFPVEARLNPTLIKAGNALALLEMLACGTVSFTDMYDNPETMAELCEACGMKVNTGRPFLCFDPAEKVEDSFRAKEAIQLFNEWHNKGDGRVKIDFDIHAIYTNNDHAIRSFVELVKPFGSRINIHMSETDTEVGDCKAKYGLTPPALFEKLGVFDLPTTAAHCVKVTDADITVMAAHEVYPVHNPSSNMKLCSGMAPVQKMLEAGIPVALGTDGTASNNNLNMFEEMHLAGLMAKLQTGDATALPARSVLTMATRNGALSQGRTDCGLLKEGFRADLCAVSTKTPHMQPVIDPADILVFSAQGSDVVLTAVDGQILYDNGCYPTLDKDAIYAEFNAALKQLFPEA